MSYVLVKQETELACTHSFAVLKISPKLRRIGLLMRMDSVELKASLQKGRVCARSKKKTKEC